MAAYRARTHQVEGINGWLLASHCPLCCQRLEHITALAVYVNEQLAEPLFYALCTPCARNLRTAGNRRRQRLCARIEAGLAHFAAFDTEDKGIEA